MKTKEKNNKNPKRKSPKRYASNKKTNKKVKSPKAKEEDTGPKGPSNLKPNNKVANDLEAKNNLKATKKSDNKIKKILTLSKSNIVKYNQRSNCWEKKMRKSTPLTIHNQSLYSNTNGKNSKTNNSRK